ncbi:hypothetical protein Taro_054472, partial [Colocasia esculenta]|nr:hypothetical protein [Colocasia esculenta]
KLPSVPTLSLSVSLSLTPLPILPTPPLVSSENPLGERRLRCGRRPMEVEPPGLLRYILGALVMVVGVVLPLAYMMFRGRRPPSSASYFSKQT